MEYDTADSYILKKGDLLFARTGASVGKTYLYREKDGLVYFAGFLIRAKIRSDYCDEFVFQNTLTNHYNQYIRITSQRSGQPGVNAQEYGEYTFMLPNHDEQVRIGELFKHIDRLITLHQRKCETLQKLKKSMLQKMFPKNGSLYPEIRFAGFTDAWEQRKLSDVANRYDNLRVPITASKRVTGTTPYYGANGIQDYVEGYTHEGEFILVAEDGANDTINYPVQYVNGRIWVNNHAHVLQAIQKQADTRLLGYAISQADIASILVGGGRAKLNADIMMKMELQLPKNLSEQHQIGLYFKNLDNLITLHQRKLETLKKMKKSMLQKMFI